MKHPTTGLKGKIARLLSTTRKEKGIRREYLATRIGVSKSMIDKLEQGTYHIRLVDFISYCQALHICPTDLLKQIVEGSTPPRKSRKALTVPA